MLATEGPIAIITLVYWDVSWGLVVLLESLRIAEPPVVLITLVQQGKGPLFYTGTRLSSICQLS
jgi:hypothetical protein